MAKNQDNFLTIQEFSEVEIKATGEFGNGFFNSRCNKD